MGEGQHMPGCPVEAHWLERSWGGEQDQGLPGPEASSRRRLKIS